MLSKNDSLKILAFDTSSTRGSAALLEGKLLRAEFRSDSSATHSTLLLKAVDFLLECAGWKLQEIGLVASGIGPGSFTGIRIGVATGLGLAQSLGIPFAGVSGLDVLARRAAWDRNFDGRIGVLLDARRNQVYFAKYESRAGRIHQMCKPALVDVANLLDCLEDVSMAAGDLGDDLLKSLGRSRPDLKWVPADLFLAEGIGRLALERKRTWRTGEVLMSEPMYIRPPDAVRNAIKNKHG